MVTLVFDIFIGYFLDLVQLQLLVYSDHWVFVNLIPIQLKNLDPLIFVQGLLEEWYRLIGDVVGLEVDRNKGKVLRQTLAEHFNIPVIEPIAAQVEVFQVQCAKSEDLSKGCAHFPAEIILAQMQSLEIAGLFDLHDHHGSGFISEAARIHL